MKPLWAICLLLVSGTIVAGTATSVDAQGPSKLTPQRLNVIVRALTHQDANIREAAQARLLQHSEAAMPVLVQALAEGERREAAAAGIVLANMRKVRRTIDVEAANQAPEVVDHTSILPQLAAILTERRGVVEPWRWYTAAFVSVIISDEETVGDDFHFQQIRQALLAGLSNSNPMKRYAAIQAAYRLRDPRAIAGLRSILHSAHRAPKGVDMTTLTNYQYDLGYTNAIGVYAAVEPKFDPAKFEPQIRRAFLYFEWEPYGPATVYVREQPGLQDPAAAATPARKGQALFIWEKFLALAALDRLGAAPSELESTAHRLANCDNVWVRRDAARVLLAMRGEKRGVDQLRLSQLLVSLTEYSDYDARMFGIVQLRNLNRGEVNTELVTAAMLHAMKDDDFDVRHEAGRALLQLGEESRETVQVIAALIELQELAAEGLIRRLGGRSGATAIRMRTSIDQLKVELGDMLQAVGANEG